MLLQDYLYEAAKKQGNRTAVRFRSNTITYQELDIASNRIAHMLLSFGVGKGARVAIYMPKSIDSVVAIFGVLKTGAAYVPLDPESPVERAVFLLGDCEVKVIISENKRIKRLLNAGEAFRCLDLDIVTLDPEPIVHESEAFSGRYVSANEVVAQSEDRPETTGIHEGDLAYILYTSGSTGKPKGVMLTHKNGACYVDWSKEYLGLEDYETFSSHAPFHFDLSILDIYLCIKTCGTLCLIPPAVCYFPDALLKFIRENQITVWYSVPAPIIQILSNKLQRINDLSSIKKLIYAGEVFPFQYLNKFMEYVPQVEVYNYYGPTETNVITAFKVNEVAGKVLESEAPIGKACDYAKIRVVDEDGALVESGKTGELVVNGDSLMIGYWNDEEKTRQRVRPLTAQGGEPFYYTGDLVYENSDGDMVYVGRKDSMVKTRGFRVELGEIESMLDRHHLVRKAAVIAVPDEQIYNRLIAWVVIEAEQDNSLDSSQLKSHCSSFLPTYMIPDSIFFLDEMPLTSTGKIDRCKLQQSCLDLQAIS
jgi:amino acid adenylation domain-containing protein